MQHTADVGMVDGLGDLLDKAGSDGGFEGALVTEATSECAAVRESHREVGLAIGFTSIMNDNQIGVPQAGNGLGFNVKTTQFLIAREHARVDELERHFAAEQAITRTADDAHTASSEHTQHVVVGDAGDNGLLRFDCLIISKVIPLA
jgi:hypothetical protein